MPRFESDDHLTQYRRQLKAKVDPRQLQVLVCAGPGCLPLGSDEVAEAFKAAFAEKGLNGKVVLKTSTGCHGLCAQGVRVLIRPQEITYQKVTTADVPEGVETTLVNGGVVDRLLYQDRDTKATCACKTFPSTRTSSLSCCANWTSSIRRAWTITWRWAATAPCARSFSR